MNNLTFSIFQQNILVLKKCHKTNTKTNKPKKWQRCTTIHKQSCSLRKLKLHRSFKMCFKTPSLVSPLLFCSLNISVDRPACQNLLQRKSKLPWKKKKRQTNFSKPICCTVHSQHLPCKIYASQYAHCVIPLSNNYQVKQCNMSHWQGGVCYAAD